MSDFKEKYEEIEQEKVRTARLKLINMIENYNNTVINISQLTEQLLREYIIKPPQRYLYANENGEKTVAWLICGYGGSYDTDGSLVLTEHGNFLTVESYEFLLEVGLGDTGNIPYSGSDWTNRKSTPLDLDKIIDSEAYIQDNPTAFFREWELQRVYRLQTHLQRAYAVAPSVVESKKEEVKPNSGGCYIATAVYGSYDCPQVWVLRRYRDKQLSTTFFGRTFVKLYYAISPVSVRLFGSARWFQAIIKPSLDSFILQLEKEGFSDQPYCD